MSNNSVIEHRANYYFVKLQEEYLHICNGDHCQALILSVMEEWTNTKRAKSQDLHIYMTYPQWVTALYGVYGRSVIIKALAGLEERRLLEKRKYHLYGKETYEYLLKIEKVNELLKELPEKSPQETLPNLDAFKNKRVQKQTRSEIDGKQPNAVYFQTGDAFKNKRNIESITQITNSDSSSVPSASADELPQLSFSSEEEMVTYLQAKGATVSFPNRPIPAAPMEDKPLESLPAEGQKQTELETPSPEPPSATDMKQEESAKDDGSYSQQGKEKQRTKNKSSTSEKPPKPTREQIKKVYETISTVKAKLYNDPDFIEVETKKSTDAIVKLIEAKGSPATLTLVMQDMWNERSQDGTYWWRFNRTRFSVTAICGQYANRASLLKPKQKEDSSPSNTGETPKPMLPVSPLGENSVRPELQRYVSDMPLPKYEWRNPKKKRPGANLAQATGGTRS